ncbi:TPA: hypothetical protein PC598_003431 [Morganella morganii]|nr:hypothetical protein [Morganella morganii]
MTVSTELSHEEYTGNGVTTDFDFRFRIFEAKHLVVSVAEPDGTERILTNGTDYTLRGVGSYRGGKVILKMPLATGWKIGIARDLPVVQETDLRNQGKFFAEVHEDALDYLTMLIQKSLGYLSLCLRKPSFISDHYDAKGNKISNLGKPVKDGDAVDLGTMKEHINAKDKRSLRVADKDIPALPGTSVRRNKQLGFDNNGMPLLLDPAETGALGYVLVDSFEKGAVITSRYQALHWLHNGEYYRWDGALPKIVQVGSTPDSAGGVGVGAWVGIGSSAAMNKADLAIDAAKRAGAVESGIQDAINASQPGQTVLTLNEDETVESLSNDYGVEIDARRGRVFNSDGVQLTTYSDPRSRFITGEQYLHYVINKMITADGVSADKKTYILWSGDSTVSGVNSEAWKPEDVGNFYAKRFGIIDVKNTALGHSGKSLYDWGTWYIDQEWSQHAAADLIILKWGINDPMAGPYSIEQCKNSLDSGLSKLRANKSVAHQSIIIMSPNSTADTPNGRDEKWYEQLTAMLRAKAKQYKCMFFDTYGMYQDSRSGAGIWLDDPYGDGRGIHPDSVFSAQIYHELFNRIYGPCAVINGSSNLYSNNGSSLQVVSQSWPADTYHTGESWWRTNPDDKTWPVDGVIKVSRFVDGVIVMELYGYLNEEQRICYTRVGRKTGGWSEWRGRQNDMTPILKSGWVVGASRSATYQKSLDGIITISAILTGGTTTKGGIIATLPVGFRPKYDISYIPCASNNAMVLINVLANGDMVIEQFPSGSVLSVNINFPVYVL